MPRRLRIAFALPGLHKVVRGAETAFEQIARGLGSLGHDVTVFGSGQVRVGEPYRFQHVGSIPREFFERFPKFPALRSHYAWEELTFSAGLLPRYHPGDFDISVGCSYPYMNWILRRGAREFPRHVFVTQNGDWMVQNRGAEYRYFDCDGLVCTNPQFFARNRERYPSVLIPNGVDPDLFKPGEGNRAAYGLPVTGPVALMVSALIPSKRVVEGIRAAANVPNLFLVVAGDGECRQEVDAEAQRLLAGRYLRLTLPRDRMPGLYRCADVFLHMSRDEASANAYMEALATGLPIVTHDWEVTRWTLEDCGRLVDCANQNAVSGAIAAAIESKSPEAVEHRRSLVRRRFAWSSIASDYSDFFLKLCDTAGYAAPNVSRPSALADVGIVAIGRNEGERLVRCLESVAGRAAAVVYVDSASDDESLVSAKRLGAEVVELGTSVRFTAARARNAGVDRLKEIVPNLKYVQFVDGDCEVRPAWLNLARQELEGDTTLAAVCGRRRERFPRRSIYNRLMDIEWNTPVGPAKSVGGDAMFRLEAFDAAGGFNPTVMAGEEPELCMRLRHSNWKLRRIDAEMTLHDAGMTCFGQWWRRNIRGGYGAYDVSRRFEVGGERLFARQTRSAMMWAIFWPGAIVAAGLIGLAAGGKTFGLLAAAIVFLTLPGQILRQSAIAFWSRGLPPRIAVAYGTMTMLGKWAWFRGQMRYHRDQARGKGIQLLEYKRAEVPQ